jgi:ADP-dependent NAD(P)H-hydrate dehydratase / NAD(P)H-hydrate epimerase
MKILTTSQLKEWDLFTINNQSIKSIDLMERAGEACFNYIESNFEKNQTFGIFCGTGNNGGDGLVIARLLKQAGYQVQVYLIYFSSDLSRDGAINLQRCIDDDVHINSVYSLDDLKDISAHHITIDAIFGIGLTRPVEGLAANVIELINSYQHVVIAIDIPSGLYADKSSVIDKLPVIQATQTLSFGLPKLSFLFPENQFFVGDWKVLQIGLNETFLEQAQTNYFIITKSIIQLIYKKRNKFSHKGTFGHVKLVAGSKGKLGAAILAASATLRTGAGLLTVRIPKMGLTVIQTALPEAMVELDEHEEVISGNIEIANNQFVAIGPGIGTNQPTQQAFKLLIQQATLPMVIDADAINILAENKTWISFLPNGCIITPHVKEFERLVGTSTSDFDRFQKQQAFSLKNQVYVVLKGAHTCITCPDGSVWFNSNGNPGMATAGCGDVLTGVIVGLLAQGYTPKQAAIFGVYLHGLAGDFAAQEMSEEAMIARDVVYYLSKAFKQVGAL